MDIVDQFGADTLRIYEMFMGPLEQVKPWQTSGCEGIHRFLSRVWRLFVDEETDSIRPFGQASAEARLALHRAIKETTSGVEELRFNTPVSRMMEFVNATRGQTPSSEEALAFVRVLSPYAPHLAEELWYRFGQEGLVADAEWPAWDPAALETQTVTIAVQVQGKLRGDIQVPRDMDKDALLTLARANENVARHLEGMVVVKEIVVPGRLINFVVRPA
jgi:leucyl-tRNA synthetase